MQQIDIIPMCSISPNYITLYQDFIFYNRKYPRKKPEYCLPKDNHHHGKISARANAKISKSINWLLYLSDDKTVFNNLTGARWKFKIAFITLTLSSKQIHPDEVIKKELLNQFLVEARKKWNIKHYVWRAETQKNGNIHFHILTDKFIPWSELRDTWNRIQNKLGYVDRYRAEMNKWHSSGFKVRAELLKTWSYKLQLRAYRTGSRNDFMSPNSSDIHSIGKVKNVSAYLSKYCGKNNDVRELEGRLWGLSQSLSSFKNALTEIYSDIDSELNWLLNRYADKIKRYAYFVLIPVPVSQWVHHKLNMLYNIFLKHVNDYKFQFT